MLGRPSSTVGGRADEGAMADSYMKVMELCTGDWCVANALTASEPSVRLQPRMLV